MWCFCVHILVSESMDPIVVLSWESLVAGGEKRKTVSYSPLNGGKSVVVDENLFLVQTNVLLA